MSDSSYQSGAPGVAALPHVELSGSGGQATLFHHGAHLTSWVPEGEAPVLWVSACSAWDENKPIRGGVPLCFPWFGPKADDTAAPVHGWARISQWNLLEKTDDTATFGLERDGWALRYTVQAARELHMTLQIHNITSEERGCAAALHTYFSVGDVRRCTVYGLEDAIYVDKMRGGERHSDQSAIEITGETDRVYFSEAPVEIHDAALDRKIVIEKSGSGATVVWNPWIAKSTAMPDFGDEEWPEMLCVETANALNASLSIMPGGTHTMTARISVTALL